MIATIKIVVTRSVLLVSIATGGWLTSAIVSAPITAIENTVVRPCEDDRCQTVYVEDEDGNVSNTGTIVCVHDPDSGTICRIGRIDGAECTESDCRRCPWWMFWC